MIIIVNMLNDINKIGLLKKFLKNMFMVVFFNVYGLIIGWFCIF